MDYKYLQVGDNDYTTDQKQFLKQLDSAFGVLKESNQKDNAELQKQLNYIFEHYDKANTPIVSRDKVTQEEKKLNRNWLVKYFKKEDRSVIEEEIKSFSPVHTTLDGDNSGAVLVPDLLASEINHYVVEGGIARRDMRYIPFVGPGNNRKLPIETGGVSVSWVDEMGQKPITGITLDKVLHELEKIAAIAVVTENLLEDEAFDLVSYVSRRIGEAIATEEDRVFFAGSTLAGDTFDGVINASGVTLVDMGTAELVDDVTADTLLKMVYSVPKHARSGSGFYMHSDVLYRIQRLRIDVATEGDGLGGYLVQPATSSAPASIWGYPITTVDELPAADEVTAGDPFMCFANLSKTSVYGDKQGIRVKLLTEATLTDSEGTTISLAQNDAVGLRVYKRVGYVNVLPEGIAVLKAGSAT